MSNGLGPDRDRHFVGPYLDPNCLQTGNQQMATFAASKETECSLIEFQLSWIHILGKLPKSDP